MNQKALAPLLLAALAIWLGLNAFFVVDASQRALVERFGQVEPAAFGPGIHFKLPLVDHVIRVDTRNRLVTLPALAVPLADGNEAQVNAYAVWQVTDASRYVAAGKGLVDADAIRQSVGAQLADAINGALAKVLADANMTALVSADHEKALAQLQAEQNQTLGEKLGVEVRQVGLLNLSWSKDELDAVRARLQAQAGVEADRQLAASREQAAQLKADADAKTTTLLADAYRKAQSIRAEGDAKAGDIYADVYGKNPEFYRFWRSLEAYRHSFDSKRDVLVLSPDSEFFRYFREPGGK